jgi:RNA polymerase sigma-70 factor (ECF subfamily)
MEENTKELEQEKTMHEYDEMSIVRSVRSNPQQFGFLYERYVKRVFSYVYARIGNVHDAEDVTAQTFLAAFESFGNFRQAGHFAPWLFMIARNKSMDHFRKMHNPPTMDEVDEIAQEEDVLGNLIHSEQAGVLSKLIQVLPEDERELLRLRFLAEMSFPQMARFLKRNEAAVKKSLYRLLARLQSQVEVSNG